MPDASRIKPMASKRQKRCLWHSFFQVRWAGPWGLFPTFSHSRAVGPLLCSPECVLSTRLLLRWPEQRWDRTTLAWDGVLCKIMSQSSHSALQALDLTTTAGCTGTTPSPILKQSGHNMSSWPATQRKPHEPPFPHPASGEQYAFSQVLIWKGHKILPRHSAPARHRFSSMRLLSSFTFAWPSPWALLFPQPSISPSTCSLGWHSWVDVPGLILK